MKANQILSPGNKYLFKVKVKNSTQLHSRIVFMKLSHHSQMQDFGADTALVPWSREARYNSQMQSFLTITAYVPRGAKSVCQG